MSNEKRNYSKLRISDKYYKHHKIQKINVILLLFKCLTHFLILFFTCFGCILFDCLVVYNEFGIIFYRRIYR